MAHALDPMTHVDAPSDSEPLGSPGRGRRTVVILVATALLVTAIGALAMLSFVVSRYTMEGSSMWPTYDNGDQVWVNRLSEPDVGDVAVVRIESLDGTEVLKRVVADGGDTVEIVDCTLLVDGRVPVEWTIDASGPDCGGDFGSVVVPDGHLFLLGDNWSGSQDSRHFGAVPAAYAVGVVIGS